MICGFMMLKHCTEDAASRIALYCLTRHWPGGAPLDRVVQIHVAGHEWFVADERGIVRPASANEPDALIVDTHGAEVADPVLALLERVSSRTCPVPIVIEHDRNIPPLDGLLSEVRRVRTIGDAVGSQGRS